MQKQIRQKVDLVRRRLAVSEFFESARWVVLWAAIAALAGVAAEKLFAFHVFKTSILLIFAAICAGILLIWWLMRVPSRARVSLLIDERLALKERMSSLMAFDGKDDVFAQAACQEARKSIEEADFRGRFPIYVSRNWFYSCSLWVLVGLLIAFLPQYDLLGYLAREKEEVQLAQEVVAAEKLVEVTAGAVKLAVQQLGDEVLDKELNQLAAANPEMSPEAVKRQAIEKLGAMSERIQKLASDMNKDSLEMTKKMLRQLKPMNDMYSQQLQQAISKGDFSKARDILKDAQTQLEQGKMNPEDARRLSEQLEALGKQLAELSEQNKQLEDDLNKMGLDKNLAKLSAEDFKKALEKQNLTPEQLEQLMKKLSACKSASKSCSNLSQAMAACAGAGGLSAEGLDGLMGQLSDMESLEEQFKAMQASLDEIQNAMACLGKGMCQGGCQGCKNGCMMCQGGGKGGLYAGTGVGANTLDDVDTSNMKTLSTRIENQKRQQGQIVASWYFKGEQIKGQSVRPLGEVIQAGQDQAAEAISENMIPRRYEESVKNYFGGLEENIEDTDTD